MKSPFDKAIKSFRKRINKLSKEEIEERLNKYKIMGDLTDKIEDIQLDNYSKYTGSNEADLHTREDIANFTTKVAIDFAEWIRTNPQVELLKYFVHEPFTLNNKEKSSEELFQEFLKDYKYE